MDEKNVAVYDAKAAEFADKYETASMGVLHKLLLTYLPRGCKVLEIGCGTGRDAVFLARNGFEIVATDASRRMLSLAAEKHLELSKNKPISEGKYPVRLLEAAFPLNNDNPLLSERFQCVLTVAILMHIPDRKLFELAYQIRQLMSDGGILVVDTSLDRPGLDQKSRDGSGRLMRERSTSELRILFERLGFVPAIEQETSDGLGRSKMKWKILVFRLDSVGSSRPIEQIATIINLDRKTATQKLC